MKILYYLVYCTMKKIHIKDDIYALVDNEDFERVNAYTWSLNSNGYAVTNIPCGYRPDGKVKFRGIKMHRFIMNLQKGDPNLDHRDLNKLNNQKGNLRFATKGQNARNKPRHSNNKSGYKGVTIHKASGLYLATIVFDGKTYSTYHHDKIEAALSYNAMAVRLHGEFARLNKI